MKVVQVGIGGMGNAWLRAVQASSEVEYAGFVEVNDQIAAEQVTKYSLDGTHVYKSLGAALDAVQPDGIINVTPPQFHKAVSIEALERGVPCSRKSRWLIPVKVRRILLMSPIGAAYCTW
ncbi:MAG: Gfo/Idh/MocA family oxidoreductase [Caldilineaceae bacterium]